MTPLQVAVQIEICKTCVFSSLRTVSFWLRRLKEVRFTYLFVLNTIWQHVASCDAVDGKATAWQCRCRGVCSAMSERPYSQ